MSSIAITTCEAGPVAIGVGRSPPGYGCLNALETGAFTQWWPQATQLRPASALGTTISSFHPGPHGRIDRSGAAEPGGDQIFGRVRLFVVDGEVAVHGYVGVGEHPDEPSTEPRNSNGVIAANTNWKYTSED
jgi:hypothetical protein